MEKPITSRSDRESRRAYSRWHYANNKAAYKARARQFTDSTRISLKAFVLAYLHEHPCIDCGEPDPIVLEFDHRPGTEKLFNLGDMCNRGYSIRMVIREIEKCDVRCANCHRRETYRRRKAEVAHR